MDVSCLSLGNILRALPPAAGLSATPVTSTCRPLILSCDMPLHKPSVSASTTSTPRRLAGGPRELSNGGPRELSNRRHRSNHHSIGRIKHVLILLSKPLQQDRVVFVDYIIVENGTLRSSINFVLHPTFACKLKTWVHDALCPDPIPQSFGRGLNSMPHYVMQVQDADESLHD